MLCHTICHTFDDGLLRSTAWIARRLINSLKLVWIGAPNGPCSSLIDRVSEECAAHHQSLILKTVPALESLSAHEQAGAIEQWKDVLLGADRIVIACEARIDEPWLTIEQLQKLQSQVPWGVVTGAWHAGARRTGMGPPAHWQLGWYRWWDGWRNWFFPELARPGSLCESQFAGVCLPIDLATPSTCADLPNGDKSNTSTTDGLPAKKLLIVHACDQTSAAWQLQAEHVGWSAERVHILQLSADLMKLNHGSGDDRNFDCLLWDDSCLDRNVDAHPSANALQIEQQFKQLASAAAYATSCAALAVGHLHLWPELQRAAVNDFFIKPSHAMPLCDLLCAYRPGEVSLMRPLS